MPAGARCASGQAGSNPAAPRSSVGGDAERVQRDRVVAVSADALTLISVMRRTGRRYPGRVLVARDRSRRGRACTAERRATCVTPTRRGEPVDVAHFDDFDVAFPRAVERACRPCPRSCRVYAKLTNGVGLAALLETTGVVQDLSNVTMPAPSAVGMIAAVQTSCADRNKLKSSTSRQFLPSRKRTLTAFAEAVELTTDSSELYGVRGRPCRSPRPHRVVRIDQDLAQAVRVDVDRLRGARHAQRAHTARAAYSDFF